MRKIEFFVCVLVGVLSAAAQPGTIYQERWPRELDSGSSHFVIYQPQVDRWENDRLESRSVVRITQAGQAAIYGIVSLSARTEIDKESRIVTLDDVEVTGVSFPAARSRQKELGDVIRRSVPDWPRTVSLDRLLASLAITKAESKAEQVALKNEPPRIIFSAVPSVLVLIDGQPAYRPVQGTSYRRVLNTPALLLFDPEANRYYVDGLKWWMTATSLNGPWSVATSVPEALDQIKATLTEGEEKDISGQPLEPGQPPAAVFVSTVPAELIETKGEPQYTAIPKTQITYVSNTDRDMFMDVRSQTFYVLLSGRWFEAKSLQGPWAFVPGEKLPADFSKISPEHPKGYVLASIPGTQQAKEAVIANQIPQTAGVKRSEAKLEVRYDGYPQFKPIPGTSLLYAVNTDTEVIQAEGRYWACRNAVWFVSEEPEGPWQVADYIPAEVYSIPPSSPLYHLRYVHVYGCNPDVVYFGYTPGYLGTFVDDGVVVYGTGWWYPGWYGNWWFGWPWTWGFGFNFSYWGGGWFWRPGPYWWYHSPWYTHRVYHEHWNPHWHPGGSTWIHNNVNVYNRWPDQSVVTRSRVERTGPLPAGRATAPRDFYAGHDGHVYENRQGTWYQQNNSGAWTRTAPNTQLEQQRQSRALGEARHGEFQSGGHVSGIPRTVTPPRPAAPPRGAALPHGAPSGGGAGRHR